ncbi:MAG: DUF202 domain-containing protein [Ferruginibacter sp.]
MMKNEPQERINTTNGSDPSIHLAVERTELALERTHLAWLRTTFTLMTAGLAIDKGAAYIHEERLAKNEAFFNNAHVIGIFLTSLGTVLLLAETIQFVTRSRQLANMKMATASLFSAASVLSMIVILLGVFLAYLMVIVV